MMNIKHGFFGQRVPKILNVASQGIQRIADYAKSCIGVLKSCLLPHLVLHDIRWLLGSPYSNDPGMPPWHWSTLVKVPKGLRLIDWVEENIVDVAFKLRDVRVQLLRIGSPNCSAICSLQERLPIIFTCHAFRPIDAQPHILQGARETHDRLIERCTVGADRGAALLVFWSL